MLVDSQQVDGLILSTTLKNAAELDFLSKRNFPYVLMDRTLEDVDVPSVGVDNTNGAYNATEMLIKAGAKNIATGRSFIKAECCAVSLQPLPAVKTNCTL